jgi:hypothetical protein
MAVADRSSKWTQDHPVENYKSLKRRSFLALGIGGLSLAACTPVGNPFGGTGGESPQISQPIAPQGEVLGQGQTRVALLVPKSATGNAGGAAAVSFRNASELAINALGGNDISLIVKDTGGTAEGARTAASQAVGEGAQMILGPVFGAEVAAAGQVARTANIPVVAFSSDTSVAGRGIYLLSFLPQSDARRIVFYAASQGRRSLAALLPNTSYGQVAEAAFRQAAAQANVRVVSIVRYEPDTLKMQSSVTEIAAAKDQYDALFVPEAGDAMVTLATYLSAAGVTTQNKLILGSGQWEDPRVHNAAVLRGGVYPAPARAGYQDFVNRYRASYGSDPIRVATLPYDAVTLAAALSRAGNGRINPNILTSASGFSGVDGIFRFLSDGTNQRGLAVYEVTGSGTRLVEDAPRSFQGAQF